MRLIAIVLLVVLSATGCFSTIGSRDEPLFAASDSPDLQQCKKKYKAIRDSYNRHARWTNRIAVLSVLLGAGTVLVNGLSSKDQPGEGAADVDAATSNEGKISGIELTGLVIAGLTAFGGGFTGLEAKWMSEDTTKMDRVRELIARLGAAGGTPPTAGELLDCD